MREELLEINKIVYDEKSNSENDNIIRKWGIKHIRKSENFIKEYPEQEKLTDEEVDNLAQLWYEKILNEKENKLLKFITENYNSGRSKILFLNIPEILKFINEIKILKKSTKKKWLMTN